MTTEEKAKAYDEALEKAKRQVSDYQKELDKYTDKSELLPQLMQAGITALIETFPQLAESEDERVRKELLSFIESVQHSYLCGTDRREKWIAYLEKQKEHSMSAEEVLAKAGLKPYKDGNQWCILAGDNIQEGICGFGDTIDEALYQFLMEVLKKQKEQKPCESKNWPANKDNLTQEQKPAEWSKEDDWKRKELIQYLKEKGDYRTVWMTWLESFCPPQDRCKDCPHRGDMFLLTQGVKSGKHDLAIKFMEYLDENRPEGKMGLSNGECEDIDKAFKENDWNKIIRYIEKYKPHWKPSNEQMEALGRAIIRVHPSDVVPVLAELRNELQKLM